MVDAFKATIKSVSHILRWIPPSPRLALGYPPDIWGLSWMHTLECHVNTGLFVDVVFCCGHPGLFYPICTFFYCVQEQHKAHFYRNFPQCKNYSGRRAISDHPIHVQTSPHSHASNLAVDEKRPCSTQWVLMIPLTPALGAPKPLELQLIMRASLVTNDLLSRFLFRCPCDVLSLPDISDPP